MSIRFEGYERRIDKINKALKEYGIASLEDAKAVCTEKGIDVEAIVKGVQPIAFENAVWAYTVGCAIAIKKNCKNAADAAEAIGIGLQSFCIPGSVAEQRAVGLGHGNLAAMLLREETKCFAFLAGHESFAAAEGAIGIAKTANKVRKQPLKVILNGLGKDAAFIISRINGFTYVQTKMDYYTGEVKIVKETAYSKGERAAVRVYGNRRKTRRRDLVHAFHEKLLYRIGKRHYAEERKHREQKPDVHEGERAERHYRRRGESQCGKTVALESECGAEVEHARHHQRSHRGRNEAAQRDVEKTEPEHNDERDLRVDAELAEEPVHRAGERGDVQTADREHVRESARLYVAVKQVVYAALIADHERTRDYGSVFVHVLVKQSAYRQLYGKYEVRLSVGEELRVVRPKSEVSAVQRV